MNPSPEFESRTLAARQLAKSLAASFPPCIERWASDELRAALSFAANECATPAPCADLPLADLRLQAAQVLVSLLSFRTV